jgi:hypothetical protein
MCGALNRNEACCGVLLLCCRYLVCGADSASLYLRVLQVEGQDIICEAQNSAVMDGLMTVSCQRDVQFVDMCYFVTRSCDACSSKIHVLGPCTRRYDSHSQ